MSYMELKKEIEYAPRSFLPGILIKVISLCIQKNVFKSTSTLTSLVKQVIDVHKKSTKITKI